MIVAMTCDKCGKVAETYAESKKKMKLMEFGIANLRIQHRAECSGTLIRTERPNK